MINNHCSHHNCHSREGLCHQPLAIPLRKNALRLFSRLRWFLALCALLPQVSAHASIGVNTDQEKGAVTPMAAPVPMDGSRTFMMPSSTLLKANEGYAEGRYGEAIKYYNLLMGDQTDSYFQNGHLWYNMGNSYLRDGRLGNAVAAYLRARSLLPRNSDIAANLKYARALRKDEITLSGNSPVLRSVLFWHYSLSKKELLITTLLFHSLFWLTLVGGIFITRTEWLRWSSWILFLVTILISSSVIFRFLKPNTIAIVTAQEVSVYSATSIKSPIRFSLHAGSELYYSDQIEGWVRVALNEAEQGWIPIESVELVSL